MFTQFCQPPPTPTLLHCLVLAACLFGASGTQAQTITNTGGLSFGSFVANTGGTIAVTSSGGRSKTGGLFLMSLQGGNSTAAQFTVSGTAMATYAITLPADGTVLLSSGSHSMTVNGFTSSPNGSGTLSGGGTQVLSVGARLTVGNAQAPGSYASSFTVTLNYN